MEVSIPQESVSHIDKRSPKYVDEKCLHAFMDADEESASSPGTGHLQELEVDLDLVIKEQGEEDYDADHSPFAEGAFNDFKKFEILQLIILATSSACGYSGCRRSNYTR
jgi:hypothetical protein